MTEYERVEDYNNFDRDYEDSGANVVYNRKEKGCSLLYTREIFITNWNSC